MVITKYKGKALLDVAITTIIRSHLRNILTGKNKYKGIGGYFGDIVFINIVIVIVT